MDHNSRGNHTDGEAQPIAPAHSALQGGRGQHQDRHLRMGWNGTQSMSETEHGHTYRG